MKNENKSSEENLPLKRQKKDPGSKVTEEQNSEKVACPENEAENRLPDTNCTKSPAVVPEPIISTVDENEDSVANLRLCILCREPDRSPDCPLLESHGCPRCAKDAWRICEACDDRILARSCPVCRSDYQGINMYFFPDASELLGAFGTTSPAIFSIPLPANPALPFFISRMALKRSTTH
jgi:hypothetical protein